MSQVHPVARTAPRTRAEMRTSEDSSAELAKRYNVSIATARKWKGRDDSQDLSHRPLADQVRVAALENVRCRWQRTSCRVSSFEKPHRSWHSWLPFARRSGLSAQLH